MMSIESIHMNKKFLLFLAQKHKLLNEENLTKLLAENLPSDLIAQEAGLYLDPPLLKLPQELLEHIAVQLDLRDLYNFSSTCKFVNQIQQSEWFWKQKLLLDFPETKRFDDPPSADTWKAEYIDRNEMILRRIRIVVAGHDINTESLKFVKAILDQHLFCIRTIDGEIEYKMRNHGYPPLRVFSTKGSHIENLDDDPEDDLISEIYNNINTLEVGETRKENVKATGWMNLIQETYYENCNIKYTKTAKGEGYMKCKFNWCNVFIEFHKKPHKFGVPPTTHDFFAKKQTTYYM